MATTSRDSAREPVRKPVREPVHTFAEAYPGRFIAAAALRGAKVEVTIEAIWREELEGERGASKKAIVQLRGKTGKSVEYVIPKINGTCLRAMYGSDARRWIGKRIVLYATAEIMPMPGRRGERPEPCIRIWGSPDIERDMSVTFAPQRRRPLTMTMRATGRPESRQRPSEPPPPSEAQAPTCPRCGADVDPEIAAEVAEMGACPSCQSCPPPEDETAE